MLFQEKTLRCSDCGNTFTFRVDDLEYFLRGHIYEPKRCPDCLQAENLSLSENSGYIYMPMRQMYPAVCADCGKDTEVPFVQRRGSPVYCDDCNLKEKQSV